MSQPKEKAERMFDRDPRFPPNHTDEENAAADALLDEWIAANSVGEECSPQAARPRRQKPPSKRDLDIYEQHVIQGRSQRDVAQEFHTDQPRVCRICAKVRTWTGARTADEAGEPSGLEAMRAAQHEHIRRSARGLVQAADCFERSLRDITTTKTKIHKRPGDIPGEHETWEETIVKTQSGSVSALRLVHKLSHELLVLSTGRIPGVGGGAGGKKILPSGQSLARQRERKDAARVILERNRHATAEYEQFFKERATCMYDHDGRAYQVPPWTRNYVTVINSQGQSLYGSRFSDFHYLGKGAIFQLLDPKFFRAPSPEDDYHEPTAEELAAEDEAAGPLNDQTDPPVPKLPRHTLAQCDALLDKHHEQISEEIYVQHEGQEPDQDAPTDAHPPRDVHEHQTANLHQTTSRPPPAVPSPPCDASRETGACRDRPADKPPRPQEPPRELKPPLVLGFD